jgi:hypothetical protein
LREIAGLKLDGHSNEEIARIVGISLAGVGRKLKVIRAVLVETLGLDPQQHALDRARCSPWLAGGKEAHPSE